MDKKPTAKTRQKAAEALRAVIVEVGRGRFRRSNVIDMMRRLRRAGPAIDQKSALIAVDDAISAAAAAGEIARHERMFWVRATPGRVMVDGEPLRELEAEVVAEVKTKVPEKWLFVDGESGEVWQPDAKGQLKRASSAAMARLHIVAQKTGARNVKR
ncbi:MAG: hypothetical protein E6R08_01060 [Nevskiaceae bacterium]|nr:MAG: hypothetical protein E6R08_01060 [Nevskiaceae bacterium]